MKNWLSLKLKYQFAIIMLVSGLSYLALAVQFSNLLATQDELQAVNTQARKIGAVVNKIGKANVSLSDNLYQYQITRDRKNADQALRDTGSLASIADEYRELADAQEFKALIARLENGAEAIRTGIESVNNSNSDVSGLLDGMRATHADLVATASELDQYKRKFMGEGMKYAGAKAEAAADQFYIAIGVFAVVNMLVVLFLARAILAALRRANGIATSIASGNLDNTIHTDSKNETGQLLRSLEIMQDNLKERIESEARISSRNARITQALDNVSGNVMVANADNEIIYVNKALENLFRSQSSDIATVVRAFDAGHILGGDISAYYAGCERPATWLSTLQSTDVCELQFGDKSLRLTANPVTGEQGERLGTVIEWTDRTQLLAVEGEVQQIVDCARQGDLSQRIDLHGKEGFFERVSAGINELVDVSERAINATVDAVGAMSRGDLSHKIEGEYLGSFGQLKDDVNATITKLTEVMGDIAVSADQVMHGSQEIAEGNASLAARTEQQAANVEETASSMEEMNSTVRQNAANAQDAEKLAAGAQEQAEQGGRVVGDAVSAMSEITNASNKIAAITGVIDEIAFQTNLLALNAAVEAARAGEQGRGFAVVASEVRTLAGRAAVAAREIKELITDSVGKIEEGSRLVDASGHTLEEIVGSVKQVSDIVAEIASASREQNEGIGQVNRAIAQIDEMTQQNAALVEEATAASESVGDQAHRLNDLVSFFQTTNARIAHTPAAEAASPGRYTGEERRKADRPWGGTPVSTRPASATAAPAPVAPRQTGADDSWETF